MYFWAPLTSSSFFFFFFFFPFVLISLRALVSLEDQWMNQDLLARFQKNPFLLECLAGTDGHVCVCVLRMRLNSHVRACMCVCFC